LSKIEDQADELTKAAEAAQVRFASKSERVDALAGVLEAVARGEAGRDDLRAVL
jgi:hypothetical protein